MPNLGLGLDLAWILVPSVFRPAVSVLKAGRSVERAVHLGGHAELVTAAAKGV